MQGGNAARLSMLSDKQCLLFPILSQLSSLPCLCTYHCSTVHLKSISNHHNEAAFRIHFQESKMSLNVEHLTDTRSQINKVNVTKGHRHISWEISLQNELEFLSRNHWVELEARNPFCAHFSTSKMTPMGSANAEEHCATINKDLFVVIFMR